MAHNNNYVPLLPYPEWCIAFLAFRGAFLAFSAVGETPFRHRRVKFGAGARKSVKKSFLKKCAFYFFEKVFSPCSRKHDFHPLGTVQTFVWTCLPAGESFLGLPFFQKRQGLPTKLLGFTVALNWKIVYYIQKSSKDFKGDDDMDTLLKEVENRLQLLEAVNVEEDDLKTFTVRLPIGLIENLENIGSVLQLKRTEVARMILTHGVDEIIKKYEMKFEKSGVSFEDMYAVELGEKTLQDVLEAKGDSKK